MASIDRDAELAGLSKRLQRDRQATTRTIWTRGRILEAHVHSEQLKTNSFMNLRDPDSGLFYFIVGYSQVGGPDIVASDVQLPYQTG